MQSYTFRVKPRITRESGCIPNIVLVVDQIEDVVDTGERVVTGDTIDLVLLGFREDMLTVNLDIDDAYPKRSDDVNRFDLGDQTLGRGCSHPIVDPGIDDNRSAYEMSAS